MSLDRASRPLVSSLSLVPVVEVVWERSLPPPPPLAPPLASPLVLLDDEVRLPYQDEEDETRRSAFSFELEVLRRVNQLPPLPSPFDSFSFEDDGGGTGGGEEALEEARLRLLWNVPAAEGCRCIATGGGGGGAGARLAASDRLRSDG